MRSFFSLVLVTLFVNGCYLSHGREEAELPSDLPSEPAPETPPIGCPVESADPVARFEVIDAPAEIALPAGTRGAAIVSFRLTGARVDLETAEYPYRFSAYPDRIPGGLGSLTTPEGGPVFTNVRFVVSERRTLYGPYDVIDDGDDVEEGELWDSNLLRAGSEFTFTLMFDIAPDAIAGGSYEIRLGDDCSLSPRFWYFDGAGTSDMPIEEIGGNAPITVRVSITPSP